MSTGLRVFKELCKVGNGLEYVRDACVPGTETWLALTELLGWLDACVDLLVESGGLGGQDDG